MKTTQIIESFVTKGQILEQASQNDAILCQAKYQICSIGEKNRNNRVYEKAVWDKVLADPDISAKLENKSLFFHAEHPSTTQSNTEKVAGVVTDMILNEEENKVYAVMEVLDTPYGRIVDTLLRAGCGIGVSTRADGELEEALDEDGSGYQRVVPESYRFVTIDFTADPSTFGSELPITVERDVTKVIKTGLDDNKIDRQYATVLLEKLYSPEAVALLESLKAESKVDEIAVAKSKKEDPEEEEEATDKEVATDDDVARCPDCGEIIKKDGEENISDCACHDKDRTSENVTSSDLCDQPADGKAAQKVVKQSGKRSKKTNNASQSVNKKNSKKKGKKKLKEAEMIKVTELHERNIKRKTTQFLTENWGDFSGYSDAVDNLVKVFKIGESDAKKYVDIMEKSKGTISAVTARSNEKETPSDIGSDLADMSERLVTTTAERDQLVENYGKDITNSTIKIKELNQQLNSQAEIEESLKKDITQLTDNLEKANEANEIVKKSSKVDLKSLQEKQEKESKKIEETHKEEVTGLKEAHKKDLISFYVSTKTKGMGLRLPESALTLLENCKTVEEVDALIRRTQNALRENLVQSANGVSEIVIESQSDPNPIVSDIRNKVGIALQHFGV